MTENNVIQNLDFNKIEDAKKIVLSFRDEYLHGNIDELANFSFWDIAGTVYDNRKDEFDGDRTKIVYAIDKILYDTKPILENFVLGDSEKGGMYSGDTINTFNTLFCKDRKSAENKYHFTPSEIEIKNEFFRTYQKIGNFYLLPNKTINKDSLNKFRGDFNRKDAWFDYFDLFLNNLKERLPLKEISNKNDYFQKLLNENRHFFNIEMDFKKFIDIFYLKDYFENSNIVSYNHITNKIAHWWTNELTEDEYKKFAFGYIAKATELINKRSIKLVEVLKENYKELTK